METNPYSLGAFISQGTDVCVFPVATSCQKLPCQLAKLINGVGKAYFQDATAFKHALVVVSDSEKAKPFLFAIPVTANALEASGAVVEGVSQNSDFRFRQWHKLFMEEGIRWHLSSLSIYIWLNSITIILWL